MHDLVVRDASLLIDGKWQLQDFAVDGGKLTSFAPSSAKQTVDAKGRLCIPGGVDLHVHFNEPGRTHWEGFATGSLAAAAGGITSLAEMPLNSIPSTVSTESLQQKLFAIGKQSRVDFGLWGGLVPGNVAELEGLAKAGVMGFKAFMSPSGTDDFINSDINTLREGMKAIAQTGKFLALHAEDPAVLEPAAAKVKDGKTALDWMASRPVSAEISAVEIAIELSKETDCPVHIVHVSSPDVLKLIEAAKKEGVQITCETCPHYLLLSIEEADRLGPDAKCAPPLRPRETVDVYWQELRNRCLDTIGSDHSPCSPELKEGKSFYEAWGGISGLQHGLPLLWQKALFDPELFHRLIELSCSTPSTLAGFKGKGFLEIGFDADFVLVETKDSPQKIAKSDLHYRHQQSAYCGKELTLSVVETWLRGNLIYKEGKPVSEAIGQFIAI